MEGTYIPATQRESLGKSAKMTHFSLGHNGGGFRTSNQQFYKVNSFAQTTKVNPKNNKIFNNTIGNFNLSTEFKSKFKSSSQEPVKIVKKNKNADELVFGLQPCRYMPTSRESYNQPLNSSTPYQLFNPSQSKPGVVLGEGKFKPNSVMKSDFTKRDPLKAEVKYTDARISSVRLGGDPNTYKTAYVQLHSPKSVESSLYTRAKLNELKKEHFQFGNDPQSKSSVNNSTFLPKKEGRQDLSSEQKHNLKSSHFYLGAFSNDFATSTHSDFTNPNQPKPPKHQDAKEGVTLGSEKPHFQTTYLNTHRSVSVPPQRPVNFEFNSSSFNLGNSSQFFSSTTQSSFRGNKGSRGKLGAKLDKELKGHHFELGIDKTNYSSVYRNYGKEKLSNEKQEKFGQETLKTHWVMGSNNSANKSVFHSFYEPKQSTFVKADANRMKVSNFSLGGTNGNWQSTNNSHYKWIKPVPDSSVKFSINLSS